MANETILVVDDDRAVREIIVDVLTSAGYDVVDAASGREAVARAEGRRIDLLLTDLVLPGIGGPQLAAELGRSRPGLPVVFMSGYSEDTGPAESVRGAAFLQKPFAGSALVAAVRKALAAAPPA